MRIMTNVGNQLKYVPGVKLCESIGEYKTVKPTTAHIPRDFKHEHFDPCLCS